MTDHLLNNRIGAMEKKLDDLIRAVDNLTTEVAETKEIVELWAAAKTAGRVIRWLAGIASSIAALWVITKSIGVGLLK